MAVAEVDAYRTWLLSHPSHLRLEPGHYRLLEVLAAGCRLDEAVEASLECDPQFDLGAALRRSFAHRVFARMTFPSDPSRSAP